MLIDPPIDKLIEKTECQYILTCAVANRAKELMKQDEENLEVKFTEKPISIAAKEIFNGEIVIVKEN